MQPGTVGQAHLDTWVRSVDSTTDRGTEAANEQLDLRRGDYYGRSFEMACPFDPHLATGVDHDLRYSGVVGELRKRAQATNPRPNRVGDFIAPDRVRERQSLGHQLANSQVDIVTGWTLGPELFMNSLDNIHAEIDVGIGMA